MRAFGLIGYPLSHSFSEKYFTQKFEKEGITDSVYRSHPLESIDQFAELLNANPDLVGLNVTIPYKVKVMDFLDEVDNLAALIADRPEATYDLTTQFKDWTINDVIGHLSKSYF